MRQDADKLAWADTGPPVSSGAIGAEGALIAGRYLLQRRLGGGGHGEVWDADDLLMGDAVAVKLLYKGFASDPARVRREISTLRLLRLPGVVRLLDEGMEGSHPFVVMERLTGLPFPGEACRRPYAWPAIAGVSIRLLETLSRIHAAGVVHLDLKPENILVDAEGRLVILDFGLSSYAPLAEGDEEQHIQGTPLYMSPEQMRGEPATAQSDLYTVGVMLYEALSGRLPHEASTFDELSALRLSRRPPALRKLAPEVPDCVAETVDMSLAQEPEDRPRSAAEVIHRLRGETIHRPTARTLGRLGGDEPLLRLLDAVRQGRSVDVVGPRGSGRSRCLSDAAVALEKEGKRVVELRPANRPLLALAPLLGPLEDQSRRRLQEILPEIDRQLREAQDAGVIVLVDDADQLDPWSSAALERGAATGSIVRALASLRDEIPQRETTRLAPLTEAELTPLFAGSARFFHLHTDAARALWHRTLGLPARVVEEVDAWERTGIARWNEGALSIDRDALDRLEAGLRVSPAEPWSSAPGTARGASLSPPQMELLSWITLAWPATHTEWIAAAMDEPLWHIEAEIEELVHASALHTLADGRVEPRIEPTARFSTQERRAAHRALAATIPLGCEHRLLHLVSADEGKSGDEALEIAREAVRLARRRAEDGALGHAIATLVEGLLALRRIPDAPDAARAAEEEALLGLWAEIALLEGTPRALDRVLYEVCRAKSRTPALAQLDALIRTALALAAGSERALSMADAVPPFVDPALERARQHLRVMAARRMSQERLHAVLADAAAWAESAGEGLPAAALAGWMGRLRYQEGRFEEAAELHARAALGEIWIAPRITAIFQSASAWMEAFRFEEAAEQARRARDLAAQYRHAHEEARAEWLLRTIGYRAATVTSPDMELVEAVAMLGVPDLEALVCLTEAAICFRGRLDREAAELAGRTHRLWTGMGKRWGALFARCLALACGRTASFEEAQVLGAQAIECPVQGLGIQMLGLLSLACPAARPSWIEIAGPLCEGVPRPFWGMRMDVLSVQESLEALGV